MSDPIAPIELGDVTAVVLAGGFGTRVQHLLPGIPKPMAPVADKPFLEWVVRYLAAQGINRVVLSVGYLAEVIEQHFCPCPVPGVEILCCQESTPLGTAGGFLHAVAQVPHPPAAWLVLNGDSLVMADLATAIAPLQQPTVDGVLVGVEVPDSSRYGGIACNQASHLTGFTEKRPGAGVVNAGVYLFRHSLLSRFPAQLPLSFEFDVFPTLIQSGACLHVATVQAEFLDIGTPESLPQAEAFIRSNAQRVNGAAIA